MGLLIGLDHGGSTTTALAVGHDGQVISRHSLPMPRRAPQPGWVEHDPEDFLDTSVTAIRGALDAAGSTWRDVDALGLANQGETTMAWDATTGTPLGPALSWQDRRTTSYCAELVRAGHEDTVRTRTGLPIDPYFAAPKIRWLIDASGAAQDALARGTLRVGGSDAYVISRLTAGEIYVTDPSTASRTALLDLAALAWDAEVADAVFGLSTDLLPEIRPSAGPHFGRIADASLGPIPITADVVDANAAMFAQGCLDADAIKVTYGTGAFVAINVGHSPVLPTNGLLPFVAWQIGATASYAVEGGVFDVGTAIDWLIGAGLVSTPEATAEVAGDTDSHGVIVVPSFSGLAAPRWQPSARAGILGMTLDTKPRHLVKAVLEGIACSVADIVVAIEACTGVSAVEVRVDGGPSRNALLMQLQADLLGRPISVSTEPDLTALGAALIAGIGADAFTLADTQSLGPPRRVYQPRMTEDERTTRLNSWKSAVDAVDAYSSAAAPRPGA